MPTFRGSMVAVITPMYGGVSPDAPIDWDRFENLLDFHVSQGTDAIVAIGTTGESATLSEREHCDAVARVVDHINGRVPVIAGTGANSTAEAIRLTECAAEADVDACLLVTPYYNKPTQEGLYQHFKAVAEAVPISQILYNVPGRTACDMLPETVVRLSKIDNIIGIKEATGEVERVAQLRAGCGADFVLLSGDDATGREFMLAGGDGVISVTANVVPREMSDLCRAALAGDSKRAHNIDAKLALLHNELFCESNPIPVKWAVQAMGLTDEGIRLPMTWLSSAGQTRVSKALARAQVEHRPDC
ncbi:MAG: 4-hydroxy-tetrahydrodipicolinate synthase [Gammaproteobacteria bacterium]